METLHFKYGIRKKANNEKYLHIKVIDGEDYDFDISESGSIMFERIGEGSGINQPEEQEEFDEINGVLEKIVEQCAEKLNLDVVF